jgi:molybdopterin synthase catalytic subunit
MITIAIQAEAFDVAAASQTLRAGRSDVGALVTFTGIVRDADLLLEHYPAMADMQLRQIAAEAEARWPIIAGQIIHRYGPLKVGEDIVLVAIASSHRQAAFEAASFLMDWLKIRAPFWKLEAGSWVEARAADDNAAARWKMSTPNG